MTRARGAHGNARRPASLPADPPGGGAVADRSVAFRQCRRRPAPGKRPRTSADPQGPAGRQVRSVSSLLRTHSCGDSYPHVRHFHARTAPETSRRVASMIAVRSSWARGIFVASGATIAQYSPRPCSPTQSSASWVSLLMTSLGELAAYEPVAGSFSTLRPAATSTKASASPSAGTAATTSVAVDLVAAQLVIVVAPRQSPGTLWSALFSSRSYSRSTTYP